MSRLVCFFKDHDYVVNGVDARPIPYAGSNILEFVDLTFGRYCLRCDKKTSGSARARVAIGGEPCSPILASFPCDLRNHEEKVLLANVKRTVEEWKGKKTK